jgi:hypothetical protein
MRKIWGIFLVISLLFLAAGQVMGTDVHGGGTTFTAVLVNDPLTTAETTWFSIELYCNQKDSVDTNPYRSTWSSPFAFTGSINVDWIDTTLSNSTAYLNDTVILKYATSQFSTFWDMFKTVYVESWDDATLPDRFNFTGIVNNNGYTAELGQIKILSWHAKTVSNTGMICIEKGNMTADEYDWIFDETPNQPEYQEPPAFNTQCWVISGDTLKLLTATAPVFDSMYDVIRVNENNTLTIPGAVFYYEYSQDLYKSGFDTILVRDADGDSLTFSYTPPLTGATLTRLTDSTARFVYTPGYDDAGTHTIYLIAADTIFADTEMLTIEVFNTNRAPVLQTITSPVSCTEHAKKTFTVKATDADNDHGLEFTFEPGIFPSGAVLKDQKNVSGTWQATFDYTPTEADGGKSFTGYIKVSDGTSGDQQDVTLNVVEANDPPVLTAIGNKSVNIGDTLRFTVSATDPDGTTPALTTSALPFGATFNTGSGSFSWTPADSQVNIYEVVFRASDGPNIDTEKVTFSVALDVMDIPVSQLPNEFSLGQNYPNPFNPSTTIEFSLPRAAWVNLSIYNVLGQQVRTVVDEYLGAGLKAVVWDGRNENGRQAASGVYFYKMSAGGYSDSKKLIMLK